MAVGVEHNQWAGAGNRTVEEVGADHIHSHLAAADREVVHSPEVEHSLGV